MALLAERGAAPVGSASSVEPPGASGTPPGPTHGAVRNGLVERMNAGESRGIRALANGRPCRLQKSAPRSKGNGGVSAERRAGPMDRQSRPLTGAAMPQAGQRPGVPHQRISALRLPLMGGRRVRTDNLARQSAGMRRAATLPPGQTYTEKHDAEIYSPDLGRHSPPSCPRLIRGKVIPQRHLLCGKGRRWMAGTSPAMTNIGSLSALGEIASLRSQ